MARLREESSPYHGVLEGHIAGEPQDRQKLWIARNKLKAAIRREVALTCASPEDVAEELSYLQEFLRPEGTRRAGGAERAEEVEKD
jgi:FAD/FMN-containing dehydrogenase